MPEYNSLDRLTIEVTEHAMEVASRPEMKDPPGRSGDVFRKMPDRMVAEQMLEKSIAFSKWYQKQPWYRKLWWRIRAWLKARLSISS